MMLLTISTRSSSPADSTPVPKFPTTVLLTNRGKIEYTSGCRCWAVQVTAEQDRSRGFQAGLNFTILGFGQDVTNPFQGAGLIGSDVY